MNKHDYICAITTVVASKGTCPRAKVGAVFITQDYEILSTGYNGAPRGFTHCEDNGCLIIDGHCANSIHAEQNAIVQAAKRGTSLKNSILYVTHTPCTVCTKLLINLGISEISIRDRYREEEFPSLEWFSNANIKISFWNES